MPRVTDAHLEARRQQILDAARACFARRGFHQATMQDICAEAALSPGAVYRYFAGKAAIIESLADADLQRNTALITAAAGRDSFSAVVEDIIDTYFCDPPNEKFWGPGTLDVEVVAEAMRNPEAGALVRRSQDSLRQSFAAIVRLGQEQGEISGDLDPEAVAVMALSFFYGLLVQKALEPAIDMQAYVQVMKALLFGTFKPARSPQRATRARTRGSTDRGRRPAAAPSPALDSRPHAQEVP